jgi:hypothetical protein
MSNPNANRNGTGRRPAVEARGSTRAPLASVSRSNLDTKETSPVFVPSRDRLYRPVRLTERAYRHKVAEHLRAYALESKELGASKWLRRAFSLRGCGDLVLVPSCLDCKVLNIKGARVVVSCGLRTCPACARMRSGRLSNKLAFAASRSERDGFAYYFITFTQRFDVRSEDDLSVDGIRRRYGEVAKGVKYVRDRVLKSEGHSFAVSFEVGAGGVMHAHAIFYGTEPDICDVRAAWLLQVPDSPQVKSIRMPDVDEAVREVAKYIVKAASPKREGGKDGMGSYTDPELAAKVEIALHRKRLTVTYGAWRGVKVPRGILPQAERTCPSCESKELTEILMPRDEVISLLPAGTPIRFTHGRRKRVRRSCAHGHVGAEQRTEHGEHVQRLAEQADAQSSGDGAHPRSQSQDHSRDGHTREAGARPLGANAAHSDASGARVAGHVGEQQSWW